MVHFFARDEAVWIFTFTSLSSKLKKVFKVKDKGQNLQNSSCLILFVCLVKPSFLSTQTKYEKPKKYILFVRVETDCVQSFNFLPLKMRENFEVFLNLLHLILNLFIPW